jgi:Alpha-(1,6)-fucosyltransferase N- and catalytic domains
MTKAKSHLIPFLCHIRRQARLFRLKYGPHTSAKILAGRCGFFGNMFITINGIRLCELAGVSPQPYWDETSLYHDKTHGTNVWDYYFNPIQNEDLESSVEKDRSFEFKPDGFPLTPLYPRCNRRESYHQCIQKYVVLNEEVKNEIEKFKTEYFANKNILGIHARFTDTILGFENRLASTVTEYIDAIDNYLIHSPVDKIFIATDSEPHLQEFIQHYGAKVIYQDCLRSQNDNSIHGHYDTGVAGCNFQKGLEVIKDAYLLSATSHLIGVFSMVSTYSLCINVKLAYTALTSKEQAEFNSRLQQ